MNGGLDPGVDHMSAMKVMKISDKGENAFIWILLWGACCPGQIQSLEHKFRAPHNVVLAGQGCSKFIQEGRTSIYPIAIYSEEQNSLK
jgi:hypothetical protein